MAKVWQDLDESPEKLPQPQLDVEKSLEHPVKKRKHLSSQTDQKRVHLRATAENLGPTTWVQRLQEALQPVFDDTCQRRPIQVMTACSGTGAPIIGATVRPLAQQCHLVEYSF